MKIPEKLKTSFDPYFEAPIEAWESFASLGETIVIEKEQTLKEQGTIATYLYFILSGSG